MPDNVWQDVKYAARSLRRTPGFACAAIVTLALGIGANTAIFTLLDAVMFKPLAVPAANELITLYENPREGVPDTSGGTGRYLRFSYPRFKRLEQALGKQGVLAATTRNVRFVVRQPENQQATAATAQLVSGNYFAVAGVSITRGRALTNDDASFNTRLPVAVVSDGFWKRVLAGSDDAVGRTILIGGVSATIVGIAPPGFVGFWTNAGADVWLPLTLQQALSYRGNMSTYGEVDPGEPWVSQDRIAWLNLIGRVPRDKFRGAEAGLQVANRTGLVDMANGISDVRVRQSMLTNTLVVESFVRGFSLLRSRLSDALFALAGMVAIVLLVTCANIANLLMARSTTRAREIGIRIAIGASRRRLIQQGLTESLLLACAGGAAGLMLGQWTSGLLASAFLSTTPDLLPEVFAIDARVLAFTAGVSIATAMLFGLLPSIRGTRVDLVNGLGGGRSVSSHSTIRGMRPLVAAQIAMSFVVVFAAALLGRTLVNFSRVNPGFATDHVVAVHLNPQASGYSTDQIPALNERLIGTVRALPGVASAAVSTCGLLADCYYSSSFRIDGNQAGDWISLSKNYVGPGYFSTVGIPIVSGREFTERDVPNGKLVAVISASIAHRYFPQQDPIGRQIGDPEFSAEIVGVVGDTRQNSLREGPVPMLYFATSQWDMPTSSLQARVTGDDNRVGASVREALRRAEPGLALEDVSTMATYVQRNILRERLTAYLVTALGGLAVILGCLGLYGVLSYAVGRRTAELGVRLALGARPSDLARMIVRDALQVVAVGVAIGAVLVFWSNQFIESLLFEVSGIDPVAVASVALLLVGAGLASCYIPARRAARIDPIAALRTE